MPDRLKPSVFSPEFLHRVSDRETPPLSAPEAMWAGPWKVEACGDENFAVVRQSGGAPEAVTERHDIALLLGAVFPVVGRDPLYRLEREDANGRDVAALKTLMGVSGFSTIGQLSAFHEDVVQPLSVAEYLLRSPASLALLLEAAPFETLEQVDALLARRVLSHQSPEN